MVEGWWGGGAGEGAKGGEGGEVGEGGKRIRGKGECMRRGESEEVVWVMMFA